MNLFDQKKTIFVQFLKTTDSNRRRVTPTQQSPPHAIMFLKEKEPSMLSQMN